jgi:hypothetical protein
LPRKGKRRAVKEMLFSKDSKGVAGAKNELFLEKRITMQGLAYNYVRGNRQNTEENALLFPF